MEILYSVRVYEILGKGQESGRTRKRLYKAVSESDARRQAAADGTDIEIVTDLGPEPPSENQITYARSLGMEIPEGASFADVSCMITNAVEKEEPAPKAEMDLAREFGLEPPSKYMNREGLAAFIYHHLDPSHKVQWFLYLVFKRRASQRVQGKIRSPTETELIRLAKELERDPKTLESILRQGRPSIDGVAPDQTRAYKEAMRLLGPILGQLNGGASSPKRTAGRRPAPMPKPEKTNGSQTSLIMGVVIILAFVLWLVW